MLGGMCHFKVPEERELEPLKHDTNSKRCPLFTRRGSHEQRGCAEQGARRAATAGSARRGRQQPMA